MNVLRWVALGSIVLMTGCAGPIERWIVQTRVHQGDIALERQNAHDARIAFRLALRVNPKDATARAGFVAASIISATQLYEKGDFDDANAVIKEALSYNAQSIRLQALRDRITQAKLKREIVLSNYPTYAASGTQIATSYKSFASENLLILKSLKRFTYTYDTSDLKDAIKESYSLQLDLAKTTNRLIAYRQLVESGLPATSATSGTTTGGGSLLPLP